jgi:HrpA-like RNA helicase
MALAERVAVEQDSPSPGKPQSTVGYQVRLDSRVTETTQITYQTIGILLRRLTTSLYEKQQVPLADVSHLILDEIHERDMTTDFVLVILRRMLAIIPHLKLVLMSATNTPDLYCNYFHSGTLGIEPIKLQIPGRTFPVEIEYLEDIEKSIGRRLRHREEAPLSSKNEQSEGQEILSPLSPRAIAAIDNSFIARLISHLVKEAVSAEPARKIVHGAILVFLPGRGEIESMARTLQDEDEDELLNIHILHSGISQSLQRLVFQPPPPRKTKLILATNVAETSITIPNVSIVIDTGHVKEARYNSAARIKELVTVWTSKASAIQRTGRAGRTGPGLCYRLYSKAFFEKCMLERTTPEILRTPLDELVLQACLLDEEQNDRQRGPEHDQLSQQGTAPIEFLNSTPDPPPEGSIIHACQHLLEIDALRYVSGEAADIRVRLTPLGYHLAQLPMDTKIGKALIVGTILGCIEPSLTLAASLSSTKNLFWSSENEKQKLLIEQGFGGATWMGGTVKGDSIAAVAVFDQWNSRSNQNKRFLFAKENGLDHSVLTDIRNLREQFRDCMVDAGFLQPQNEANDIHSQNALLTSCCLVAGLYPNIATLVRPTRGKLGFRGGRLLTKDGDSCTPSAESFQSERVRHASESGRDAYCVYQSKNQIIGATKEGTSTSARKQIFLSNVNFVSRFAILLFGGVLEVKDNSLVVDSWLKFKVGEKGRITAILVSELRRELDMVLLDQMVPGSNISEGSHAVVDLVNALLQEE